MAPTSNVTNSTSPGNGGSDPDEKVSLYIAIAALVISSLLAFMQLLFSYVTSSDGRNKTNAAALGEWHRYTRLSMREFWKGKLHVSYGVMDLSEETLRKDMMMRAILSKVDGDQLQQYQLQGHLSSSHTKDGLRVESEEIYVLRKGVADNIHVPLSELTPSQRAALSRLRAARNRSHTQYKHSHASYVMLAHHLNYDFGTFRPVRYEDAEQIPMGCSSPLATIRMSDAIKFGYIIDMNIQKANPSTGEILMTGQQCKIYSEHLPNVGLVSRYDVKSHGFSPTTHSATELELIVLMSVAGGTIGFLETVTSMSLLGYNSMSHLVDLFLAKAQGDGWQNIVLGESKGSICGDKDGRWNHRWTRPDTSLIAALLAVISVPAVAKGFPHSELLQWTKNEARFSEATRAAALALQQTNYLILSPPEDFIPSMFSNYHVKSSSYKVADNFGCESGGIRGYLSTNLALFTKMVASCWKWSATDDSRQRPPVPILLEFINYFRNGELLTSWAASHSEEQYNGVTWTMTSRAAFWIQITMFDTWIGCMIDRLMGATALREVPIPAEFDEASACADAAAEIPQDTSFNPVRSRWLKLYLRRLAEGHLEQGDSFMSSNPREDLEGRWEDMEIGAQSEWLTLDAVITMRAATVYAMLMELDDSSVMLELKGNDPLLYMT